MISMDFERIPKIFHWFSKDLIRNLIDFLRILKGLAKNLDDFQLISKGFGKACNYFRKQFWRIWQMNTFTYNVFLYDSTWNLFDFQTTFQGFGKELNLFLNDFSRIWVVFNEIGIDRFLRSLQNLFKIFLQSILFFIECIHEYMTRTNVLCKRGSWTSGEEHMESIGESPLFAKRHVRMEWWRTKGSHFAHDQDESFV